MVRTNNLSPYKKINRKFLRFLGERVWKSYRQTRCDVSINFVSVDRIQELNQTYFKKTYPTDVISFNLGESPDGKEIGDIYICPEFAEESVQRFKCSLEDELARLVIHGMLHFIGFEDTTDDQRKQMRELENKFLERFPQATYI